MITVVIIQPVRLIVDIIEKVKMYKQAPGKRTDMGYSYNS